MHTLTIVCPVDYSDCSARALRFAGALADHFRTRLVVMHALDPLLAATAGLHRFDLTGTNEQRTLRSFVDEHIPNSLRDGMELEIVLTIGSPGLEIITLASSRDADLVVMGTHGFSRVRRAVFGSTLQSVLRRAPLPVLAVPSFDHHDPRIHRPLISSGPVLAPVDFSPESRAAAHAAAGVARALALPLLLVHAVAPPNPASTGWHGAAHGERTSVTDPEKQMADLVRALGTDIPIESRIVCGEPAEQIARLAREKRSAVVVMSLARPSTHRPHHTPGSIAYRVLCLAPVPVLALPETASGRLYVQYLHHGAGAAHGS